MEDKGPSERIVITGMGAVTSLGHDVESSWENLIASKDAIKNIRETVLHDYPDIPVHLGAPVENFALNKLLTDSETLKERDIHLSAQFALEAGLQALTQAGLIGEDGVKIDSSIVEPPRFGVSIGSGIGGGEVLGEGRKIIDSPGGRVRPNFILQVLPARVSEVPSIAFGAQAFADPIFAECATGASNIMRAADELRLGRADVVLAGGTETGVNPISIALFGALRALDTDSVADRASRPFNKNPKGLVMGEGAGVLVLETLEHARKRGAFVLAELAGYGRSSDAYSSTNPSGEGAVRAFKSALAQANLLPSDITDAYVNAHATSTGGDVTEIKAIAEVLEPAQVAGLSSTKGATGHPLGAAGGIETIFSIKALREGVVPPSLKLNDPIVEAVKWNMSPFEATIATNGIEFAIKNSFGFGGLNNVLIFKKFNNQP